MTPVLRTCPAPLDQAHDLLMFDLDGVVYAGSRAVDRAPEVLGRLRATRAHLAFVTNNASRTPQQVAERLVGFGVDAVAGDVVTSAQAAAHLVRSRFGPARVLALGGHGLREALLAESHTLSSSDEDAVDVVVSGFGPQVRWQEIMHAASLVASGVPYVASNSDTTFPTERGIMPGHGVLVDMISRYAGVVPLVAGKPAQPLLDETIRRVGGERPLMVGDRLDTDIEGAVGAGVPSLLVLTGVTGLVDLVAATPNRRPTYLAPDLTGLLLPQAVPEWSGDIVREGGWRARVVEGVLDVTGMGEAPAWWHVVATAAWHHLDTTGTPADVQHLEAPVHGSGVSQR